jgi:hypothetical protein
VDPGHCLIQPADLNQWGGLVPAGVYSRIGIHDLLQMLASDPTAQPGAQADVLSTADDQVSAATEPGPRGCC